MGGIGNIMGFQSSTSVEFDILADIEDPLFAIFTGFPVSGQSRNKFIGFFAFEERQTFIEVQFNS